MPKFDLSITETLSTLVEVEAKDYEEARKKVQAMYDNEEIILGGDDFQDMYIQQENL